MLHFFLFVSLLNASSQMQFKTKGLLLNMMRWDALSTVEYWKKTWTSGVIKYLGCSYITPFYSTESIWPGKVGALFNVEDSKIVIHGGSHSDMHWRNPRGEQKATDEWISECRSCWSKYDPNEMVSKYAACGSATTKDAQARVEKLKQFLDAKYRKLISTNAVKFYQSQKDMVAHIRENFFKPIGFEEALGRAPRHFFCEFCGFGIEKVYPHNEIKISASISSVVGIFHVPGKGDLEENKQVAEYLNVPLVQPKDAERFDDLYEI